MPRRKWIKLWTQETLYRSISQELAPEERWVWIAFLCLAGDSVEPGAIMAAPDIAWTQDQLAQIVKVPLPVMQSAFQKMLLAEKIEVNHGGIIYIKNWGKYQTDWDRVSKYPSQHPSKEKQRDKNIKYHEARRIAWENLPHQCDNCNLSNETKLEVHHIDGDHSNNELSNLQILCTFCHKSIHTTTPTTSLGVGVHTTIPTPEEKRGEGRGGGSSLIVPPDVISNAKDLDTPPNGGVPKAKHKKVTDPRVKQILDEITIYLGYPDKTDKIPIPNYSAEGKHVKTILSRHFTVDEILAYWKQRIDAIGGQYVAAYYINQDIGKTRRTSSTRRLPTTEELQKSWLGGAK